MSAAVRKARTRLHPPTQSARRVRQSSAEAVRRGRFQSAVFIQYLPHVMPGLLKAAMQNPIIQVLEVADDDDGHPARASSGHSVSRC